MRLASLLVCVLLVAPAAQAQLAAVPLGAKVRIISTDLSGPVEGSVVLRSRDVVTIRDANRELRTFPVSQIALLEMHRKRMRADGARGGAVIGAALGVVGGLMSISGAHTCTGGGDTRRCIPAQPPDVAKWVGLWTASGAVSGALVGAIRGGERWERLEVAGRAAVNTKPRGTLLSVAFR